ncbi:hypothetical protein HDU86_000615, partial [Geranomyces michiganensis]
MQDSPHNYNHSPPRSIKQEQHQQQQAANVLVTKEQTHTPRPVVCNDSTYNSDDLHQLAAHLGGEFVLGAADQLDVERTVMAE